MESSRERYLRTPEISLTHSVDFWYKNIENVVVDSTSQYSLLNCPELDQIFPRRMDTKSRLKPGEKGANSYYKIL